MQKYFGHYKKVLLWGQGRTFNTSRKRTTCLVSAFSSKLQPSLVLEEKKIRVTCLSGDKIAHISAAHWVGSYAALAENHPCNRTFLPPLPSDPQIPLNAAPGVCVCVSTPGVQGPAAAAGGRNHQKEHTHTPCGGRSAFYSYCGCVGSN